ncbi:P-type conjugative transfer ATPase TrbB [Candidatus Jidaibacter acanthamoebae]|nr:P-type conjugative transfer ATPase TrbB [Candidatus Jidaibacter acanthamoeba]
MSNILAKEEQNRRLEDKLRRELGEEIISKLNDPKIIEIMLNPDGKVWYDVIGEGLSDSSYKISKLQAENLLSTIASVYNTVINTSSPILEVELPFWGSRFTAISAPVVSSPSFTIRKRPEKIWTLQDYLKRKIITAHEIEIIRQAIVSRKNILIVGGTGSGKTTLVNALLHELFLSAPKDRILIIEDTIELKSQLPNTIELRTSQNIDINRCLRTALRMRPDRIIVGEIRGQEASTLIKAWNTGHPGGISTVHANSAAAGLIRIEQLIQEANIKPIGEIIAEAINLIIFIERIKSSPWRKVKEIKEVKGYENGKYILNFKATRI